MKQNGSVYKNPWRNKFKLENVSRASRDFLYQSGLKVFVHFTLLCFSCFPSLLRVLLLGLASSAVWICINSRLAGAKSSNPRPDFPSVYSDWPLKSWSLKSSMSLTWTAQSLASIFVGDSVNMLEGEAFFSDKALSSDVWHLNSSIVSPLKSCSKQHISLFPEVNHY